MSPVDIFPPTSAIAAGVPAGTVLDYAGTAAPDGWFIANGQHVSIANYPALFAACGHNYGTNPGDGTFVLPNLTGRFILGQGSGRSSYAIGGVADAIVPTHDHASTGTVSSDHTHSGGTGGQSGTHTHNYDIGDNTAASGGLTRSGFQANARITAGANQDHSHAFTTGGISANHTHAVNAAGVSPTDGNMPPYAVLLKIIKW